MSLQRCAQRGRPQDPDFYLGFSTGFMLESIYESTAGKFPSTMMDTLGSDGLGAALPWIWATRHGAVPGITEEQSVDNPR